jgi:hypothetical protein
VLKYIDVNVGKLADSPGVPVFFALSNTYSTVAKGPALSNASKGNINNFPHFFHLNESLNPARFPAVLWILID